MIRNEVNHVKACVPGKFDGNHVKEATVKK